MHRRLRSCATLLVPSLASVVGLLPTPSLAQTIVWTDQNAGRIQGKSVNAGEVQTLVQFPAPQSASLLDYDPVGGKIYYLFDPGPQSAFLQRANLDGSDPEDLPNFPVRAFSVNAELRKLYWLESFAPDYFRYSELDGTGAGSHTYEFCCLQIIEAIGDDLFWGTGGTVGKGVWRADADGSNEQFLGASVQPMDLVYDTVEDKLYLAVIDAIYRLNPDGSDFQLVVHPSQAGEPSHLEMDSQRGKLYWIDTASRIIRRSNLDGSNVENFVTVAEVGNPNFEPMGIALVYDPTPIPTLSVWGLAAMGALLVASAALIVRRRRQEGRPPPGDLWAACLT